MLTTATATVLLSFTILQYAGEITDSYDVYDMNQIISRYMYGVVLYPTL